MAKFSGKKNTQLLNSRFSTTHSFSFLLEEGPKNEHVILEKSSEVPCFSQKYAPIHFLDFIEYIPHYNLYQPLIIWSITLTRLRWFEKYLQFRKPLLNKHLYSCSKSSTEPAVLLNIYFISDLKFRWQTLQTEVEGQLPGRNDQNICV